MAQNVELRRREIQENRYGFKLRPSEAEAFEQFAAETGRSLTDIITKGIQKVISEGVSPESGLEQVSLPLLAKAPCGPLREATSDARPLHVSPDVATWIEAAPRDVFIVADGESMEGAGIPDGALLLVRPFAEGARPRRGDVVLVQVTDSSGNCVGTVKRWMRAADVPGEVELHDGDGNVVELPSDATEVRAIGAVRGLIAVYR